MYFDDWLKIWNFFEENIHSILENLCWKYRKWNSIFKQILLFSGMCTSPHSCLHVATTLWEWPIRVSESPDLWKVISLLAKLFWCTDGRYVYQIPSLQKLWNICFLAITQSVRTRWNAGNMQNFAPVAHMHKSRSFCLMSHFQVTWIIQEIFIWDHTFFPLLLTA